MTDPLRWDAPWRVDARLSAQRKDEELRELSDEMGMSPMAALNIFIAAHLDVHHDLTMDLAARRTQGDPES